MSRHRRDGIKARCWIYSISTLVLASGVFAAGVATEGCTMTTSQDIAEGVLAVSANRYEDPDEDFTDLEVALADTDWSGIAIRAPTTLDLTRQREIPVLVARKHTGLRGSEVPSSQNSFLVATDVTHRKVHLAGMYPLPAGKTPMSSVAPPPMPKGASAIAETSLVERMDARGLLALDAVPAEYRITALTFDWVSNTIAVRVADGGAPIPGASSVPLDAISAGTRRGLPTWLATPTTPSLPQGRGTLAALAIEPGSAPAPRLKAVGTFSVVGDATLILKAPYVMDEVGGVRKSVVAHVPVTLVVLLKNGPSPIRRDLMVPIYADRPMAAGDLLTGYFALDLLSDGQAPLQGGAYVAYLIVEGQTFGPVSFSAN